MSERRIAVLRHGRTAWNAQRRFQGHADPPLDEVGRGQAWEVAALVAALQPDLLVSSNAQRCVQTAAIIGEAASLPVRVDDRLRERGLGHWEGLTREEVAERYPDEYADWLGGGDVTRRGGESREQVTLRAMAAYADLPDVPVTVLVTHSATAMALVNALLGLAPTVRPLASLANCHWSELVAAPHGVRPDTADGSGAQSGWRLRGHNLGAPGAVLPLPAWSTRTEDDAADADA